jgi:hypothetical protein
MASYSMITAAIALGIDRKRLENLLARARLPGAISRGRQGRSRRLDRNTLLALATLVELQDRLGIPARVAAGVAAELVSGNSSPHRSGPVTVAVDLQQIDAELTASLTVAMEMAPRPRRGRPGKERAAG